MSVGVGAAVLACARIDIEPDCWPARRKMESVRVSMTAQTWNGVITLNRSIPAEGPEQLDRDILKTIREMAETIESPHNWKG